jgi:Domain of unknown function (DUF4279)
MAHLKKSAVSLRIQGENLVPEEITGLLGVAPTHSRRKGDKLPGQKGGPSRVATSGIWSLSAPNREPEDVDGQVQEILSQVSPDLSVWREIAREHKADLFCGLFMNSINEGLTISAQSLLALGERGIEIGLDIYALSDARSQ